MKTIDGKIKVAIIYHCVAHYREPIFRLLCEQDNAGIEYTIVSGANDHTPSLSTVDISKANIPIDDGGLRWRIVRNTWFGGKVLWQSDVIKLALSKEYDAIIYLGVVYHISTWISCLLARLTGKKTFMWSHGFLREERGIKGFVRSMFYRLSDEMLLYHNRARDIFIKRGFSPDRLKVIYNSLDVNAQKVVRKNITKEVVYDLRKKLFVSPDLPVILWIGRLTPHKQLDMILSAVNQLKLMNLGVNVLFIGNGSEKDRLIAQTHELGLKDVVVFYGACHQESELGPLIAMSDMCVAPGEVGLTCMHSLVYGTPVITHDNPDYQMPEYEAIMPGESGAFFTRGDVNSLAHVIYDCLHKPNYSRDEIRENCYKVIDDLYNPDHQAIIINNAVRAYYRD